MSFKPKNIDYAEKYTAPGLKVNEAGIAITRLGNLDPSVEIKEIYINESGLLDDGREYQKLTVIIQPPKE